ncbi:hypothetical protein O0I10_002937, partial [Lichtheimia ornata]
MSQVKATTMSDDTTSVGRMLTRRASRSVATANKQPSSLSEQPLPAVAVDQAKHQSSEDMINDTPPSTSENIESNGSSPSDVSTRVTRSQSAESTSHHNQNEIPEESFGKATNTRKRALRSTSTPTIADKGSSESDYQKTKRSKPNSTSNKAAAVRDDKETRHTNQRITKETRQSGQRMTKETREARRAQRKAEAKEKLAELDRLEKAVKEGNHPEYLKLIEEIEEKRIHRLKVGEAQYQHAMRNQTAIMEAARKSANDHFQLQKKGLRRRMIEHVQQKINALEQEYYSHNRQSIVPLSEQEADHDFELMRSAVTHHHYQQQASSPSLERFTHHQQPNSPAPEHRYLHNNEPAFTTSSSLLVSPPPQHHDMKTSASSPQQTTSYFSNLMNDALPPRQPPLVDDHSKTANLSTSSNQQNTPANNRLSSPTLDGLASLADRQQPPPYHYHPSHCIVSENTSSTNQLVK